MPMRNYLIQKAGRKSERFAVPTNCKKVSPPDSQKDHHANCICRPIKIRKNISMIIALSVFVLVAVLMRELLWRMIKTILQKILFLDIESQKCNTCEVR